MIDPVQNPGFSIFAPMLNCQYCNLQVRFLLVVVVFSYSKLSFSSPDLSSIIPRSSASDNCSSLGLGISSSTAICKLINLSPWIACTSCKIFSVSGSCAGTDEEFYTDLSQGLFQKPFSVDGRSSSIASLIIAMHWAILNCVQLFKT